MTSLFYPSVVINLKLRFDEAMTVVSLAPESVKSLAEKGTAAGEKPRALASKDNLSQVMNILPKTCSVEMPGYRQANKFSLTLEYKDFPIDPRVMRAIDVEVHLGAVEAGKFGRGITENILPAKKRQSYLDTRTQGGTVNEATLLMSGLVDTITAEHTASGSLVHMEGRDYRGILLDTALTAEMLDKIKLGQDIKSVVTQIVKFHPLLKSQINPQNLSIEAPESDWGTQGLPKVVNDTDLIRPLKNAVGADPKMPMKGDTDKISLWDAITQFCFLVNAVPYFQGKKLMIRRAQSLYERLNAGTPGHPTPFKDGKRRTVTTAEGKNEIALRRLVYGFDIDNFKMERKLCGTGKRPTILVVSHDPGSKQRGYKGRILEARWPEKTQATSVTPTGEASQEEILRIPVAGIRNKDRLKSIARSLYEEIGRAEISGSIETKDLASFGGDNQDPDLLSLRPGDAVEIVTAANTVLGSRPPVVAELISHQARSEKEEVDALTKRLGDANLARVIVATARNSIQELQTVFRVKEVKFAWDATSGVSIGFDFQNYVEARK